MDIREVQKKVIEFRDARDWAQYHNPKDLGLSLSFEGEGCSKCRPGTNH
jgi:hypothetical protein